MGLDKKAAAAAFVTRRGDLGLTQVEVAGKVGMSTRTVQNFEAGNWPNTRSRAALEQAVRWPAGEILRIATRALMPRMDGTETVQRALRIGSVELIECGQCHALTFADAADIHMAEAHDIWKEATP